MTQTIRWTVQRQPDLDPEGNGYVWAIKGDKNQPDAIRVKDGTIYVQTVAYANSEEHARLIAAAPQLLEALEKLATLGNEGMKPDPKEWITFHDKVAQVANAAIKAATEG